MKKILFILAFFLKSALCSAEQNVYFHWADPCYKYNEAYGWYVELSFSTGGCLGNMAVLWVYQPGCTSTFFQAIPPAYWTSNSAIFPLPMGICPAFDNAIATGSMIEISYNWRCVGGTSVPWESAPNDLLDPKILGGDTWKIPPCPPSQDYCVGDFEYCYNTKNMGGSPSQYSYEFDDVDHSLAYNLVNSYFNSTTCTNPYNKYLLITDTWDFGDGSTPIQNQQIFVSVNPNSTFTTPSVYHTFTNNISGQYGYYNICHTKKISIICGSVHYTGTNEEFEVSINSENVVYNCKACTNVCMNPTNDSPGIDDFPTTYIFDIGNVETYNPEHPDIRIDSCIGDFTHCAYTAEDMNDQPYFHKFDDNDYSYLYNSVVSLEPTFCGSVNYGGHTYSYHPGYVVYDEWYFSGLITPIIKTNSLDNPTAYNNGFSTIPLIIGFPDAGQEQVCHMKRIEIGCIMDPVDLDQEGGTTIPDPNYVSPFYSFKTILECTACTDFCVERAEHTQNPHPQGKPANEMTKTLNTNAPYIFYPNPSTHSLSVKFESNKEEVINIVIKDLNGRIVKESNSLSIVGENTIILNLDNIANGNYFIEILSSSNKYVGKVDIFK